MYQNIQTVTMFRKPINISILIITNLVMFTTKFLIKIPSMNNWMVAVCTCVRCWIGNQHHLPKKRRMYKLSHRRNVNRVWKIDLGRVNFLEEVLELKKPWWLPFCFPFPHQIETHTRPKISHILHLHEMNYKLSNVDQSI